ncbi:hypothetical protein [Steroidobacter sp.]|uniref:hypothetical protein n=1 Tax=Steroidobacter sp. TaxID=1978227 RepID=UPI001A4D0F6D|nr:hypothetical protein [Steroidobacter sp.]MBL8269339.1 hypothetical protein [Steroidobacter sp.]
MLKQALMALLCSSAALSATALADNVAADALKNKRILFVTGPVERGAPNDDPLIKDYLGTLGATVTVASAADALAAANGKDLVMISSTVNARELDRRLGALTVPVATWNAYAYPLLNMTGDKLHQDFSVVREKPFHNENHADYYAHATSSTNAILAAAKIPQGMFAPLLFSGGVTDPSWGKPARGADVAVSFEGDYNKAAVFSYEKGALMMGNTVAPARRVGLFLGDNSWSILSDAQGPAAQDPKEFAWFSGRRLFDASLRWAVSPTQAPVTSSFAEQRAALARAAKGKKLLFVRRYDLPWPENEASDQAQLAWLRELGFDVSTADHMEPDSRAQGKDLVIISASTNKYKLGIKYADVHLPIVLLEAKAVDALSMVTRRRNTDYGVNDHKESLYPPENYVDIARSFHPIAAGLPAGQLKLFKTPGVLAWSRPPAGAQVIATIPNQPEHATMFAYEKGATMANDMVAPGRRALFPMDAPRFPDLTEQGRAIYAALLLWALSTPPSDHT